MTSVLKSVVKTIAAKYDWLTAEGDGANISVKSDYKDYALLTALDTAEREYFADYAAHVMVINESYSNPFETLKAITEQGDQQ